MFVATSTASNNNNQAPSYIVPATTTTTATNNGIDTTTTTTTNTTTPQTLSDIKLICTQRKKKTKRHIYLTFVESQPLSSSTDRPCIEIIRKSNSSSQPSSYSLDDCISFEYFDTVKNDFQSFIYAYYESYTISIFFSDENFEKKTFIIKHLEYMHQSKTEKSSELNNNSSQDPSQSPLGTTQSQQQTPILPCQSTTDNILHTFDVNLIPYGPIIHREHSLIGPARLYFTTTDLYVASINCIRTDLKTTIANQCPAKDKAILCIPYFTIKNYGNRSNIFLVELGKSNYGNGEIHMKCHSSSLASTIHLLVSPVIEERPLILSSAFQNQLLTTKRIEKSKNIQPPIQLTHDTTNRSILDSSFSLLKNKTLDTNQSDSRTQSTPTNEIKSRLLVGFFRTLTKNVSQLRRSATFHNNNNNHHNHINNNNNNNNEQVLTTDDNLSSKNKSVVFNVDDKKLHNDQHPITLPESQKIIDSTSSLMTKKTSDTTLTSTSTSTINTNKQEMPMGTYIDMGPTIPKSDKNQEEKIEDEVIVKETTATADIGVNTIISLSPHVRSAIIVGNSVHLIADEKTVFPIGQRSFTSPASVMQPFKTQLNDPTLNNPHATSSDLITTSSTNDSNSILQPNSVSNSQQSLFLSYGIVTFNKNDIIPNDQIERPTSPQLDGSTIDRRLNSDLSLMSMPQQQGSTIYPFDSALSSSSSHIFRALSVSTHNIGDTNSGQIRTPHGSIIFLDDHLNDQTATYLLGLPTTINDETIQTNLSRLSSFNLTTSMSRPQLSNIDEKETSTSSTDPYALVEPLSQKNPSDLTSIVNVNNPLPTSEKSLDYVDLLIPTHNENSESNEQQQINNSDEIINENNDSEENECETIEQSSTKLYTDIDFHQTQRRDRIVQSAARAKMEDQTPPFVL